MKKRIELIPIISGGVSLGSYESGIMYALILSSYLGKIRGDFEILIPAISGTSAGSITSLLSSYVLTDGLPVNILYTFWVDYMDASVLLSEKSEKSIFNRDAIIKWGKELLSKSYSLCEGNNCKENIRKGCFKDKKCKYRLMDSVKLGFSLTSINGRKERISDEFKEEDLVFSDKIVFSKKAGENEEKFIKYAVASSSFPIAFTPVSIIRKKEEYPYISDDVPDEFEQLYIDGGVLNNRPVNIGVDLSFDMDVKNPTLLIIECSVGENETKISKWDIKKLLYHILITIRSNQPIVKDVRGIEKTNRKINGLNEFYKKLSKVLEKSDNIGDYRNVFNGSNPAKRELFRNFTQSEEVIKALEGISSFIEEKLSLKNKLKFDVAFIHSTPYLLSGDFMGHFGGFFNRDLRRNDFIRGVKDGREFLNKKYNLGINEFEIEKYYNPQLTDYGIKNLTVYEKTLLIKLLTRLVLLFVDNYFLKLFLYPIIVLLLYFYICFFF